MATHRHSCSLLRQLTLYLVAILLVDTASAQSIFRDRREIDREPIIPEIEAPKAPEAPKIEEVEEKPEEDKKLTESEKEEIVLNRKREAAANRSQPGVVALLRQAGQVSYLQSEASENLPVIDIAALSSGVGPDGGVSPFDEKLESRLETRSEARTFSFSIPAPRGQILSSEGEPLAQNKVVNYAAIMFDHWGDEPDDSVLLKFAADRIHHVNNLLGTNWDLQVKTVREHYKNRRWMPLIFSGALTRRESESIGKSQVRGVKLVPIYLRHYPNEKFLSHVIGYVGKRPPRAVGPITNEEAIWRTAIGVMGLEKAYDKQLTGTPGKYTELYDGTGNKLRYDKVSDPQPGHSVITTIDLRAQQLAENLLRWRTKRSAFVVMDCNNGDILCMASHPQYNPNDFIPSISVDKYKWLSQDPEKPMYPRAYQASYPPASTYKIATAMSFLDVGHITGYDTYPCPGSWTISDLTMRNWHSGDEGYMNVVGALSRSCNTWFYEIGIHVGADTMYAMASRLGLGEKTGLPISENSGFIPNNKYWIKNYRSRLADGDEAAISIGQHRVKCTPLQIARMMAAVGNGERVLKPRLVKQIQDVHHNVVEVLLPEVRNDLNLSNNVLKPIRDGMYSVVNGDRGTGKKGYHKIQVSAKTGTGQWKKAQNQNIAWFAGYFPSKNPVYSFALVYEGQPHEKVSGGKSAAPIVNAFMDSYINGETWNRIIKRSRELRGDYRPILLSSDTSSGSGSDLLDDPNSIQTVQKRIDNGTIFRPAKPKPKVKPTASPQPPTSAPQQDQRRDTLFKRLFRRR